MADNKVWKPLKPLDYYMSANIPAVFGEELTYYEKLCRIEQVVNDCINNIDFMLETYNKFASDMSADNQAFKDGMTNKYNELLAVWKQLQDWITHYFDNLDVQQEINNKLDAMMLDGSLANIIAPFIPNEVEKWLNENVPTGQTIAVDKSLSISGAAADAKVTGNKINWLDESVYENIYEGTVSTSNTQLPQKDYVGYLKITFKNVSSTDGYFTLFWQNPRGVNNILINSEALAGIENVVFVNLNNPGDKISSMYASSPQSVNINVKIDNVISKSLIYDKVHYEDNGEKYLYYGTITGLQDFDITKICADIDISIVNRGAAGYFNIIYQEFNVNYIAPKQIYLEANSTYTGIIKYDAIPKHILVQNVNNVNAWLIIKYANKDSNLYELVFPNIIKTCKYYDFIIGPGGDFTTFENFVAANIQSAKIFVKNGTYILDNILTPLNLKRGSIIMVGESKERTILRKTTKADSESIIDISNNSVIKSMTLEVVRGSETSKRCYSVHSDFNPISSNCKTVIENCIIKNDYTNPVGAGLQSGQMLIIRGCDIIAGENAETGGNGALYIHSPSYVTSSSPELLIEGNVCEALNGDYALHCPNTNVTNYNNIPVTIRGNITATTGPTEVITDKNFFQKYGITSKNNSNPNLNIS